MNQSNSKSTIKTNWIKLEPISNSNQSNQSNPGPNKIAKNLDIPIFQSIEDATQGLNKLRLEKRNLWVVTQIHFKGFVINYQAFNTWIKVCRVTEYKGLEYAYPIRYSTMEFSSVPMFKSKLLEIFSELDKRQAKLNVK